MACVIFPGASVRDVPASCGQGMLVSPVERICIRTCQRSLASNLVLQIVQCAVSPVHRPPFLDPCPGLLSTTSTCLCSSCGSHAMGAVFLRPQRLGTTPTRPFVSELEVNSSRVQFHVQIRSGGKGTRASKATPRELGSQKAHFRFEGEVEAS